MILFLAGLAVAVFAIIFAVQNGVTIDVYFLSWEMTEPLAVFLLAAFVAGVLAMFLFGMVLVLRQSHRIYKLKRRVKELEASAEEGSFITYQTKGLGQESDPTI